MPKRLLGTGTLLLSAVLAAGCGATSNNSIALRQLMYHYGVAAPITRATSDESFVVHTTKARPWLGIFANCRGNGRVKAFVNGHEFLIFRCYPENEPTTSSGGAYHTPPGTYHVKIVPGHGQEFWLALVPMSPSSATQ